MGNKVQKMSQSESYKNSKAYAKATGFYSTKKVVGSESKEAVLDKFGLNQKSVGSVASPYQIIDGVPHKFKDGVWTPLTKVSK
jgi:hypothetical protein